MTHQIYKKSEAVIETINTIKIIHYIILNNGILRSNSSVYPRSEVYISQYTPLGVYGLIVNENNEVNISLMIVKMI